MKKELPGGIVTSQTRTRDRDGKVRRWEGGTGMDIGQVPCLIQEEGGQAIALRYNQSPFHSSFSLSLSYPLIHQLT